MRHTANTERRRIEAEVDRLFQEAVILMFKGNCIGYSKRCTKQATVAHHLIPRNNKMFRHMLGNGVAGCQTCHDEMHRDKQAFLNWLKQHWYPIYKWHTINKHAHPERVTVDDLRQTRAELKSFIKENK